jgi:hypothetical protein
MRADSKSSVMMRYCGFSTGHSKLPLVYQGDVLPLRGVASTYDVLYDVNHRCKWVYATRVRGNAEDIQGGQAFKWRRGAGSLAPSRRWIRHLGERKVRNFQRLVESIDITGILEMQAWLSKYKEAVHVDALLPGVEQLRRESLRAELQEEWLLNNCTWRGKCWAIDGLPSVEFRSKTDPHRNSWDIHSHVWVVRACIDQDAWLVVKDASLSVALLRLAERLRLFNVQDTQALLERQGSLVWALK